MQSKEFQYLELEQMKAILTSVQEGIEFADAEGNIVYINPSFTRITGILPEERIGKNIYHLNKNGVLATTLKTEKAFLGVRTTAPGKGGEGIANSTPIYENGKLIGAIITILDITDFLSVSKKLAESNSMLKGFIERSGTANYSFDDIIGCSPFFQMNINLAKKVAPTNSTVLLEGESGTGKELFAHAIHHASDRFQHPFISINCAAIPEGLIESEFFGHEQGAFTGASKKKMGMFELAHQGTLFLDEVGELSLILQAKLLRAIQEKEIRPVGSIKSKQVDVRLIAATNRNLKQMMQDGLLREDLYYRLSVLSIHICPLRERISDLDHLIPYFIKKLNKKLGTQITELSNEAIHYLTQHTWPGNVRELENVLEYSFLTADSNIIEAENVLPKLPLFKNEALIDHSLSTKFTSNTNKSIQQLEKERIIEALLSYGTDVQGKKKAAKELQISLATLYNKIKKYEIII
jgi:PAS domain S-box-containing protein